MKTEWTPQMMQVLRITAAYARAGRSRRAARLGADQASDHRSSGATIRAAALIERSGRDPAETRDAVWALITLRCRMFRRLVHCCFDALDRTNSLVTLVRLWVLDWFAGP